MKDKVRTERKRLNRQQASVGHTGGTKCPAVAADERAQAKEANRCAAEKDREGVGPFWLAMPDSGESGYGFAESPFSHGPKCLLRMRLRRNDTPKWRCPTSHGVAAFSQ